MKTRLLLLLGLTLLIALSAVFWPQNPVSSPQAAPKPSNITPKQIKHDLTHLMRLPEDADEPFWITANVPEPETPRLPSAVAITGTPAAPDAALKTAARLRELEASPATPENLQLYNQQAIVLYDQDPTAATDWLNRTEGFAHLSPALASIAASLGERGHLDIAHILIDTITDPDTRRSAVLDIYSLRARNGQVTRDQLTQAGWDTADIEQVFSHGGD